MKKFTSLILAALLTLSLVACGGISEDAVQYKAYTIAMMGIDLAPEEIAEGDILLALDENGKAEFTFEGETFDCEWEVKGEEFTLIQGKDEFTGTMVSDVVTIVNMMDTGMDIGFLKEGAEMPVDNSKPLGKYLVSAMDMAGTQMNYADIKLQEMQMDLIFDENGGAEISSNGDAISVPVDYDAMTIDVDGAVYDFAFEDEQIILSLEMDGIAMGMTFTAEDSDKWEELEAQESAFSDGFPDAPEPEPETPQAPDMPEVKPGINMTGEFVAPGYGAETTVPVETLSNPSRWYGIITIEDYQGPYRADMEGEHEAYAAFGNDGIGDVFEIYADGIYSDTAVISSYYVEMSDYYFEPIADEYADIFDTLLTEGDETWYTPTLINGVLSASYNYKDDDESFIFTYELAMIAGTDTGSVKPSV